MDGMNDAWEASFAAGLLAFKPAAEWGEFGAQLLAGNLEPGSDFTSEGITAATLSGIFGPGGTAGTHPYEDQFKRNILSWGLHLPAAGGHEERNEGLYFDSNDGYFGNSFGIDSYSQLQPSFLEQHIDSTPWGDGSYGAGFSRFSMTPSSSGAGTDYSGQNVQVRTRWVDAALSTAAREKVHLKVTRRRALNYVAIWETVATSLVTLTIPANQIASQWEELKAPVAAGFEHEVALVPATITVAFGLGPEPGGESNSRELLEAYLGGIDVARSGDVWFVENGESEVYGVEIVTTADKLIQGLKQLGQTVVFDGHSNFGLGPNFSGKLTHKTTAGFTRFGAGTTSIPKRFRGDGTENDIVQYTNADGTELPTDPEDLAAIGRIHAEGWAYLTLQPGEIPPGPLNYIVEPLERERFPNLQGVAPDTAFIKQGSGFNNEWPKDSCKVEDATKIFVQGVVEEKPLDEIMTDLNQPGVGNADEGQSPDIYDYKSF